jgi:hypothetical protein
MAVLLGVISAVNLPGCGEAGASAPRPGVAAPAGATARRADGGFASPQDLLRHLVSLNTAEARFEMLDLVLARSNAEKATVELTRQIEQGRMDFAAALRDIYGEASVDEDLATLGMARLSRALRASRVTDAPPRRAVAVYSLDDAAPKSIVLIQSGGSWWIAAETFLDGQPVTDLTYFPFQSRLHGLREFYAQLAADVRAGAFLTERDVWAAHRDGERRAWRNVGGMNMANMNRPMRKRPPPPPPPAP